MNKMEAFFRGMLGVGSPAIDPEMVEADLLDPERVEERGCGGCWYHSLLNATLAALQGDEEWAGREFERGVREYIDPALVAEVGFHNPPGVPLSTDQCAEVRRLAGEFVETVRAAHGL